MQPPPSRSADTSGDNARVAPAVSVIVPAYNVADAVAATLESVAAQTYRDFEAIVVDDGSSDSTADILARCAARWPWLRWTHQANAGASVARNVGAEHARGEFLAFLDVDDLWLPEKLALQLPLFDGKPATSVVYADAIDFNDGGHTADGTLFARKPPARGWILPQYFMGNFILTSTAVVRRSAFAAVGGFDPSLHFVEDVDFFLRLAEHHPFDFVDRVLVKHRLKPEHLRRRGPFENQLGDLDILDRWVKRRPDLFPKHASYVRRRYATVYARMGHTLLARQDYAGSRRAYRRALASGQRSPGVMARAIAAHVPVSLQLFGLAKSSIRRLLRRKSPP